MKTINLLAVFLLLLITTTSVKADQTARKIYKENSGSVVLITGSDKNGVLCDKGSGVYVRIPHGKAEILTATHVVTGAGETYKVIFPCGLVLIPTKIIYCAHDIAVLLIGHPPKIRPLTLTRKNAPIGSNAYCLGYPLNHFNLVLSSGIISEYNTDTTPVDPKAYLFGYSGRMTFGNSGGPIFDSYGRIIGICDCVQGDNIGGDTINYAIPVSVILHAITCQ